jgi:hypothetical protein
MDPSIFIWGIILRTRIAEGRPRQVQACVPIYDEDLQPVPGARVTARWINPVGRAFVQSAKTHANGAAYFSLVAPDDGSYTLFVMDVQARGYLYDLDV